MVQDRALHILSKFLNVIGLPFPICAITFVVSYAIAIISVFFKPFFASCIHNGL
ncbi:hypothetical protein HMPREF3188_00463 [Tissierellia bacterium KA00581]|nr:hypothetical protein HMPREF3188_00463 [Tissierellia bacterium KA00581]